MSLRFLLALSWASLFIIGSCSSASHQEKRELDRSSSTDPAPPAPSVPLSDTRPAIVAFGDSLTQGVSGRAYPEFLQERLNAAGYAYQVQNAGVSGDTTTDALSRLPAIIESKPVLVLLEFGGNDGLRGIPVQTTKQNLDDMIVQLRKASIPTVLLGITLPPNYGPDYVKPFSAMFPDLARQHHLSLLPFLLAHVYRDASLMQPDGIHPNEEGNRIVAQDVQRIITPLLKKRPA